MRITIDNIENYMNLFDGKRINFGNPSFVYPIFVAMLQAYPKDKGIKAIIGNGYIIIYLLWSVLFVKY